MTMLPEDPDLLKWALLASGGLLCMVIGLALMTYGLGVTPAP